MMLIVFVDDIIAVYRKKDEEHVNLLKKALLDKYKVRIIGEVEYFLGIKVIRDRDARKL